MSTVIPQYHEKRIRLSEMDALFQDYIGGPDVVDVGETLRLMLGDYFYGEAPPTSQMCFTIEDRTIVFPIGSTQWPLDEKTLVDCVELMGEIFWTLADTISTNVLQVTPNYTHRPNQCFYKFFKNTRELVVYTPLLQGVVYPTTYVPLDGRAVISVCVGFLPSWINNVL